MKGKEIVKRLNERSTNPSARFEEILRKIFPQVLKDEGKQFAVNPKIGNLTFDLQFPQGINEYKKPIWVEIKYFKEKKIANIQSSIEKQFSPHKQYLYYAGDSFITLNYILYIVSIELNEKEKIQITDFFKNHINRYEIIIWDINDLDKYFNEYAEYIIDIIPELKEQAIKNIVDKSKEQSINESIDPEFQIKKLQDAYKKDDVVLFLGAGVSVSAGLPTWNGLLSKLLLTIIEKNVNSNLNEIQKNLFAENLKKINDSSPLQIARYISSGLSDDFEKEVSKELYKTLNNPEKVELLKSIEKLCVPTRAGIGIKAITNYNFDDIIEKVLDSAGIKNKPIYNDNSFPNQDEIGIFHVHGFLPQDTEQFEGLKDSLLIFSEKNYHTIMSDPYNWSNLTQLNFFRENTCLFIGQSGTDPNLRRLLEIAKQRTKLSKHFIILKRTEKEFLLKDFGNEIPDEQTTNTILEVHHRIQEISFDEIGLNVLWINSFDEINDILKKIKN
jgi:hypothetical protein